MPTNNIITMQNLYATNVKREEKSDPKRVDIRISDLCGAVFSCSYNHSCNNTGEWKAKRCHHIVFVSALWIDRIRMAHIDSASASIELAHGTTIGGPPNRYGRHCETEQKNPVDICIHWHRYRWLRSDTINRCNNNHNNNNNNHKWLRRRVTHTGRCRYIRMHITHRHNVRANENDWAWKWKDGM